MRQAALRVADAKPHIFNTLLTLVSDAASAALKAAQKVRDEERAAIAAMQAQAAQNPPLYPLYNQAAEAADEAGASSSAPIWHRTGFPRPIASNGLDHTGKDEQLDGIYQYSMPQTVKSNGYMFAHRNQAKAQIKKTLARIGRIWSASAGMMHFLF